MTDEILVNNSDFSSRTELENSLSRHGEDKSAFLHEVSIHEEMDTHIVYDYLDLDGNLLMRYREELNA